MDKSNCRAILAGVNYNYPMSSARLRGCVADAFDWAHLMLDLQIPRENVCLLVDDRDALKKCRDIEGDKTTYDSNFSSNNPATISHGSKQAVFDSNKSEIKLGMPTRERFLEEIKKCVQDESVKVLFLTYSGHGTRASDYDGDGVHDGKALAETDGYDEVFCLLDNNNRLSGSGYLKDDDFNKALNEYSAGRKSRLMIYNVFDCCHSATIGDFPYVARKINGDLNILNDVNGRSLTDNVTMCGVLGCCDIQYSMEDYDSVNKVIAGRATRSCTKTIRDIMNQSGTADMFTIYCKASDELARISGMSSSNDLTDYSQILNMSASENIGIVEQGVDQGKVRSYDFVLLYDKPSDHLDDLIRYVDPMLNVMNKNDFDKKYNGSGSSDNLLSVLPGGNIISDLCNQMVQFMIDNKFLIIGIIIGWIVLSQYL